MNENPKEILRKRGIAIKSDKIDLNLIQGHPHSRGITAWLKKIFKKEEKRDEPKISSAPISLEDIVDFIGELKPFAQLDYEILSRLAQKFTVKKFSAKEVIFNQGDLGKEMFIPYTGKVRIRFKNSAGQQIEQIMESGDVLGEIALITGEPRTATAITDTDETTLLSLNKNDFDEIYQQSDVAKVLSNIVADRLECGGQIVGYTTEEDDRGGRYGINKIIGQGGTSVVYEATDLVLERRIALKMLLHAFSLKKDFLKRLRQEAKIMANFNHPNIASIYDAFEDYRTFFIAMELLKGYSLKEILEIKGKLSISEAHRILLAVASGLSYAHSHKIVHRDLKPGNIILIDTNESRRQKSASSLTKNMELDPFWVPKIIDFGLAVSNEAELEAKIRGTLPYTSPEQLAPQKLNVKRVDERADIYSLGIVAFRMVKGKLPFEIRTIPEAIQNHLSVPMPVPSFRDPNIPKWFDKFIESATNKHPDDRFQSMKAVMEFLKQNFVKGKMVITNLLPEQFDRESLDQFTAEFVQRIAALGVEIEIADRRK